MVHQKVDKFIFVFGSGYGAFGIWNGVLDINPNPRIRLSVRLSITKRPQQLPPFPILLEEKNPEGPSS